MARRRKNKNTTGALSATFTVAVALTVVVLVCALFVFIGGSPLDVVLWGRVSVVVFVLPFVVLSVFKSRVLLGTLERELYAVTSWRVDLDRDGRTGDAELADATPVYSPPVVHETVRLVRVNEHGVASAATPPPVISSVVGGKTVTLPEDTMRQFIKRAGIVGLSWPAWRSEDWTREQWDNAITLLVHFGCLSPKTKGKTSQWVGSPADALVALGLDVDAQDARV